MNRIELSESEFNSFFKGFYNELLKFVWRICGQREIAEEICQEAFLRYYEHSDTIGNNDEARYWLIRVAKNLALNFEKRLKREGLANRRFVSQPHPEILNEGEESVLREESRTILRKAIATIPYKWRVALILKEYNDYSYAAIAKILKISESNVKIKNISCSAVSFKKTIQGGYICALTN